MAVYCCRWRTSFPLQNLFRTIASDYFLMSIKPWFASVFWGGFLSLGLAFALATYFRSSFYDLFHDWTGWRSLTGTSPNDTTYAASNILWALLFCSCWWMLWRLDQFLASPPSSIHAKDVSRKPSYNPNNSPFSEGKKAEKSENFQPEESEQGKIDNEPFTPNKNDENSVPKDEEMDLPTQEDLLMGEILGLEKEQMNDYAHIKATYRLAIAQYHPDKVSALGKEIREIAEKKAKDINLAYQYFRKKHNR